MRYPQEFLADYTSRQLAMYFPDQFDAGETISEYVQIAYERTDLCIASIIPWCERGFDYLVSWQYATFLYYLSNSIWQGTGRTDEAVRLFLLNKALNGFELFYEIQMPPHFFLSHTPGLIFSKASYGDYSVFHQGCTVGRHKDARPELENGIVMFPGSMIIGDCLVRENTVLAPGVSLVNTSTPGNCYVFQGKNGRPFFKELNKYYADEYFIRKTTGRSL